MKSGRFWTRPHFWTILALFAVSTILHYRESLGILGWINTDVGLSRHVVERIIFLLLVLYGSLVFGLRVGLAITLASLIAMMPRAVVLSPHRPDAVLELVVIIIASIALCFYNDRIQKYHAALEKAQAKLQADDRQFKHYAQRLKSLSIVSDVLSRSLNSKEVIAKTIDMIPKLIQLETVLVYTLDDKSNELVLAGYHGISAESVKEVGRVKLGEGLNGRVASTGDVLLVGDVSVDRSLAQPGAKVTELLSHLVVPMRSQGKIIGTVDVGRRVPGEFLPDHADLLGRVADQVASALANAYLFESVVKPQS